MKKCKKWNFYFAWFSSKSNCFLFISGLVLKLLWFGTKFRKGQFAHNWIPWLGFLKPSLILYELLLKFSILMILINYYKHTETILSNLNSLCIHLHYSSIQWIKVLLHIFLEPAFVKYLEGVCRMCPYLLQQKAALHHWLLNFAAFHLLSAISNSQSSFNIAFPREQSMDWLE